MRVAASVACLLLVIACGWTEEADPPPPGVAQLGVSVVSPTDVGTQIISGTKPADTSIWRITGTPTELVPRDGDTRWSALITLSDGANDFDVVARDRSGNDSAPVHVSIVFNPPGPVSAGQVKIELELRDLWDYVGDEFPVCENDTGCATVSNGIDFFSVDIWVEGPITRTGPSTYEPCVFDAATQQREHIRFVRTVNHGVYSTCPSPATNPDCNGYWWDFNYRNPNLLAAYAESGRWASAPFPLDASTDRRTPGGNTWAPGLASTSPCTPASPELYFPCTPSQGGCAQCASKPKLMQAPAVDGVTEATVRAGFVDGTGLASDGSTLGNWKRTVTYRWNLRDWQNAFIERGPYLLIVVVNSDRARPGDTVHRDASDGWDHETCRNDAAHDNAGAHRAEGIIEIDGTARTLYWREKGWLENVAPCQRSNNTWAKCDCSGDSTWPCPSLPNSRVGERIWYLTPDRFTNPGNGQDYPVRIEYCPNGPCP